MKKSLLFLLVLFTIGAFQNAFAQEMRIAFQSFDSTTAENYMYTVNPASYEVGSDIWAPKSSLSDLTASEGTNFWAIQDLDNGNGGGDFDHTINFNYLSLAGYENVKISFDYQIIGFDTGDSLAVKVLGADSTVLAFEALLVGDNDAPDSLRSTDGIATYEFEVPAETDSVSLILIAHQNGGNDYAMFDNVQVMGTEVSTENVVFFKDFEDESVTSGGWFQVVQQDSQIFEIRTYDGNVYGQISAYNGSGADDVKTWYVSPEIDFDAQYDEVFTFKSKNGYHTAGDDLKVYYKTGELDTMNLDPTNWTELTATFDPHTGSGYGDWTESGEIDLAEVSGTGHIAFYYSNPNGSTVTWQLDDIKLATMTPTSIDDEVAELPAAIELNQNYPNPFNPATNISFNIPSTSEVTLQVFDITGRLVSTLVNGTLTAGSHNVNFNAANLTSGVYIYRLSTATGSVTRKMTLLK